MDNFYDVMPSTTDEWVRFIRCLNEDYRIPKWFDKAARKFFEPGRIITVNVAIEGAMNIWAEQQFESTKRK